MQLMISCSKTKQEEIRSSKGKIRETIHEGYMNEPSLTQGEKKTKKQSTCLWLHSIQLG